MIPPQGIGGFAIAIIKTESHNVRNKLSVMSTEYTRIIMKVAREKKTQFPALLSCTPTGIENAASFESIPGLSAQNFNTNGSLA